MTLEIKRLKRSYCFTNSVSYIVYIVASTLNSVFRDYLGVTNENFSNEVMACLPQATWEITADIIAQVQFISIL